MNTPAHLLLWRLLALSAGTAGETDGRPLLPALPSDDVLINIACNTTTHGSFPPEVFPPSAWRAAINLGVSPTKVISRLAKLGFSVTECEQLRLPTHLNSADLTLMDLAEGRSRRSGNSYEYATLVVASARLDIPMTQVARRLAELGFDSVYVAPSGRADGTDVRLVSNLGAGPTKLRTRFLKISEPVSALYVLLAAEATGLTPPSAANRLRRLGLNVPDFDTTVADLRALPATVLQAMKQLLIRGQQPRGSRICQEALDAGCQPGDLARALTKFGIATDKQLPEQLTDIDKSLLRIMLPLNNYVGPRDLIRASLIANLTTQNAAARFEAMGFEVCETALIPPTPDTKDREVLRALSGFTPMGVVKLREFAMTVAQSGYPYAEVAQRLAKFGIDVEYIPDTDHVNPELIPQRLPAPANSGRIEVPLPMILSYADDIGVNPAKIGDHLRNMGCSVPQIRDLLPEEDALIRSNSPQERLNPQNPLTMSDLLVGAIRAGMTVREAAERLTELGYRFEFPDLEAELQRLLPLVPRMSEHRP